MYRFPVKVEQHAEGFVVTTPAVPGCVTSGRTRGEALRKAREVLQAIVMQAGPGFSPAALTLPPSGDAASWGFVEVAPHALQPC
jgi:hypothetical protein